MKYLVLCGALGCMLAGCANVPPAPSVVVVPEREFAVLPLPYCRADMDSPDYWACKLPAPDKVLLTPGQIVELNRMNLRCGLVTDVFSARIWDFLAMEPDVPEYEMSLQTRAAPAAELLCRKGVVEGYTLFTYLKVETERIKRAQRWDAWGKPVPPSFYRSLDENLNLPGIRENNPVRYGLTSRRTDIRYYPTYALLASKVNDLDFDVLQVSSLQALQPVAILHSSGDGKWLFVISPYCQGWVWKQDVVSDLAAAEVAQYLNPARRLVVIGHAAEAVWQPGDTSTAMRFYMGTVLPLLAADEQYYQVGLPDLDGNSRLAMRTAYIPQLEAVQEGYLPCTSRNLLNQAFRVLHTPYSWGGKGEYRDCSQLVMDIYATMGVVLPRNSVSQGAVGSKRIRLNRRQEMVQRQVLLDRLQAPALLQFPGHIMLYLGREGDRYYAIHDIWSWRKSDPVLKEKQIIIGQVVVSDLSLGEGSRRGSLLERLTTINFMQP